MSKQFILQMTVKEYLTQHVRCRIFMAIYFVTHAVCRARNREAQNIILYRP